MHRERPFLQVTGLVVRPWTHGGILPRTEVLRKGSGSENVTRATVMTSGVEHTLALTLPALPAGAFTGIFWQNIETEY